MHHRELHRPDSSSDGHHQYHFLVARVIQRFRTASPISGLNPAALPLRAGDVSVPQRHQRCFRAGQISRIRTSGARLAPGRRHSVARQRAGTK